MSPRKKKESALRSRTQEKLDKSLKEAATGKKSKPKPQPQPKVKSGLGRNPESDEHLLQSLESKRKKLKEKKAYTALITINELDFLLELARE
tara:strand:+ start:250 stop:525 length:276 start_codon:yes stop_codon:yes gene_type:complete